MISSNGLTKYLRRAKKFTRKEMNVRERIRKWLRRKQTPDLEDAARILQIHPETLKLFVRQGRVKTIEPHPPVRPPYFFSVTYLKSLPRFKVGRPKRQKEEEEKR